MILDVTMITAETIERIELWLTVLTATDILLFLCLLPLYFKKGKKKR